MNSFDYIAENEAGTRRLAHALAECLEPGLVIVLSGTLGAGKTQFVRYFAAASGIDEQTVTSPTYVLCQEYTGQRHISHLDVYRINDLDEFANLGPDEIFSISDVTFIEWGEQVTDYLPSERLEITIEVTGEHKRRFHIAGSGAAAAKVLGCITAHKGFEGPSD
jgi:tRNA threonylcarbamoyladenosine biosynthesis protein TsaE